MQEGKPMNDNLQQLIQDSTYRALSSNEEKVILEQLKSIPEIEAYEINCGSQAS